MENLDIVKFEPALEKPWDAFVNLANNGTLFHKRAFLSYHPQDRFIGDSLLFYKKSRIVAVLPAAGRHGDPEKLLVSHPGSSFGGFVCRKDLSLRDAMRLTGALKKYALANHYGGIDITLPPAIYLERPSHYLDFALYQAGFRYRKRELSSVIPLVVDEKNVLRLFTSASRRAVRRAQKLGVEVRIDDDYKTFYEILQNNLKMRHNVIPTHSLEEMEKLAQWFPEDIFLFSAFVENQMAGGIVLFSANVHTALAFYISHDEAFQRYRAVNLLFYEVCQWCIRNNFKYLDFGLFTVNMEPNLGLGRFKEGFGAQGVFRDSMKLVLAK